MKTSDTLARALTTLHARFDEGDYSVGTLIDLVALVASADGEVDAAETAAIASYLAALLGTAGDASEPLAPDVVENMVRASCAVVSTVGAEARAAVIAEALRACDAVDDGLRLALAVAFASEGLSAAERDVITRVARAAGCSDARLDELVAEASAAA